MAITTNNNSNNSSAPAPDQIFGEDQHPEIQHNYGMNENERIFFMCLRACLFCIAIPAAGAAAGWIGQLIYHLTN